MRDCSQRWQVAIQSDRRYIPWVRRWIAACVADAGIALSARGVWRCSLVLIEAINNAMVHAHRERSREWIEIELVLVPHRVAMTVLDQGPRFVMPRHRRPRSTSARGRGFYLMRTFCRRVTVSRRGGRNRVRMFYEDVA